MTLPTIVQTASSTTSKVTLSAPATPGNTLLGVVYDRDYAGVEPPPNGGWTLVANGVDAINFDRACTVYRRTVSANEVAAGVTTDDDGVSYTMTPSSGQDSFIIETNGDYAGIVAKRDSVASTTAMDAGGPVTPTAGTDVLVIGFASIYANQPVTESGGVTQLLDAWPGFSPYKWAGYRAVTGASGAYSVGGTISGTHFTGVTLVIVGAAAPFVDFDAAPRLGGAPLVVDFENLSTTGTTWLWDFGNGQTSTLANPTGIVYTAVGSYDVSLTADGVTTVTKADFIVVYEAFALDPWIIIPPGDAIEFGGLLNDAYNKAIRPVRNEPGSGSFTINRHSANATAAILAPGNLVKVRIPAIDSDYIFAWFMEQGDFGLVSTNEEGGEEITIGGRGALSYWERAIWLSESFVVPWWDVAWGTPPTGARGHVTFAAGTYRHYTIAGGVITGYTNFTTAGFEAYFDSRQTYDWPSAGSKRFLVHIMTGETNAGWYVHPHQDGVTETLPSATVGTSSSVLLSDISADTPGAILYHLYLEGTDPGRPTQPIPLMTVDFDDTTDSNGDPWATTDAIAGLTAELGETYLETIAKLLSTGAIDVEMDANLVMHAYNSQGRDLTGTTFGAGKVRFVKGVNIADELRRERDDNPVATFIEVVGTDNVIGRATLPDAASRVAREIGGTGDSDSETVLEAMGLAALNSRLIASDAIGFRIATGDDDAAGLYLPGPEGTDHGDFWLGDVITLHTGTGEQDFDQEDERVFAISITEDEAGNLEVTPEVGSTLGEAERRLYAGTSGGTTSFTQRTTVTDTTVSENAHPDLDVHDALGLATDAELAAHTGDTTAAHAASAIAFTPNGSIAATNVQAAIQEVRDEAGGGGGTPPGYEFDYVQITSSATATATTEATANALITGSAVAYDGSTVVLIEAWFPYVTPAGGAIHNANLALYDGSSSIGLWNLASWNIATVVRSGPIYVARRLTPSAATHTYSIRGYVDSGTATWAAGAGGSGASMPAYIRIIKVA